MDDSRPLPAAILARDEKQLRQLVAVLRDVLGRDLVGAYLHGSAVLGELRPRSDLDLLAVSRRRTIGEQKRRLADRLLAISGSDQPGSPRPLELTIVVESEVRPWRYPPSFDFQYGEWLRDEFERGNVEPWPTTTNPDLASLITVVLLANRLLLGPPPAEVFAPIPRGDYLNAIVGDIEELVRDLDRYTRNVLLTLARIWCTIATDEIRAKDEAASWALARLPHQHRRCSLTPALSTEAKRRSAGTTSSRRSDRMPTTSSARSRSSQQAHLLQHHPGVRPRVDDLYVAESSGWCAAAAASRADQRRMRDLRGMSRAPVAYRDENPCKQSTPMLGSESNAGLLWPAAQLGGIGGSKRVSPASAGAADLQLGHDLAHGDNEKVAICRSLWSVPGIEPVTSGLQTHSST
jgi:streptomycin 3"-adenylyltransferase